MKIRNILQESLSQTEATSTDRFLVCENVLKNRFADERKKNTAKRLLFPFDYGQYLELLTNCVQTIFERRRESTAFVIDTHNRSVLEQLYLYLRQDSRFDGDLRKGILLMGKYGCGKTAIMQSFVEMYNTIILELNIRRPMLKFVKSTELLETLKNQSVKNFAQMPLVIDELGREPKQIMDYGNLRSPMIELLSERYDTGAWTHGTSNFTLETLSSDTHYGRMTGDRLKAIFNFIELKGGSRRK